MLGTLVGLLEKLPPELLRLMIELTKTIVSAPPSKRAQAIREAEIAAKVHAFDLAQKKARGK